MGTLKYAATPTLNCREQWSSMTDERRLRALNDFYDELLVIEFKEATQDGCVILKLKEHFNAAIRGKMLLDIEDQLKKDIDHGITVWLEPMGDRSSLRNLRGVTTEQIIRNVASSTAIETGEQVSDIEKRIR